MAGPSFRFALDGWKKTTWWQRYCARQAAKLIWKSNVFSYQFGGHEGGDGQYVLLNVDKYQLIHWVLCEAGYSCSTAMIEERCGSVLGWKDSDGALIVMRCNEEPVGFLRRLKWRLKRAGRAIRAWRQGGYAGGSQLVPTSLGGKDTGSLR
jgi:hypothetical protein